MKKPVILYVDDSLDNGKSMMNRFKNSKFDLVFKLFPGDVWEDIDKISPSIILSDFVMKGMNGVALQSQAKKRYPQAVRLIITAQPDVKISKEEIQQAEVFRFINKAENGNLEQYLDEALIHFKNGNKSPTPKKTNGVSKGPDEYERELTSLRKLIVQKEEQLNAKMKTLQDQTHTLNEAKRMDKLSCERLESKVNLLTQTNESLRERVESLEKLNEQLSEDNEKLKALKEAHEDEIYNIKKELSSRKKQNN